MPHFVRIVQGDWKIEMNGDLWRFYPKDPGVRNGVLVSENIKLVELIKAVRNELRLGDGDYVQLSYCWPGAMVGDNVSQNWPTDLTNDADVGLFMALRIEMRDIQLRVRVIPESILAERDYNGGSQVFGSGPRRTTFFNDYNTQLSSSKPCGSIRDPICLDPVNTPAQVDRLVPSLPATHALLSPGDARVPNLSRHTAYMNAGDIALFSQVANALTAKQKGKAIAGDHEPPSTRSFIQVFTDSVRVSTQREAGGTAAYQNLASLGQGFMEMLRMGSTSNTLLFSNAPNTATLPPLSAVSPTSPLDVGFSTERSRSGMGNIQFWAQPRLIQ